MAIEVEDTLVSQIPKQRLEKSIRRAIFSYGFAAPDQPREEEASAEPPVHLPGNT